MPDIFGFETPDEARARVRERFRESSQRVSALGRNASPGQQVGAALSNIFGGSVQKYLDTRAARKEEREQLLEEGIDPENAKRMAKLSVKPEFAAVRKATETQQVTQGAGAMMQELIQDGVPERTARGIAMLQVAQRLRSLGDDRSATMLSSQAGELINAQRGEELERQNLKARTAQTETQTDIALKTHLGDDDTYVKFNQDGTMEDFRSVAVSNTDEREKLREQGYLNVGAQFLGVELGPDAFKGRRPPSQSVQENITAGLSMLSGLRVLEGVTDQTGLIEGPLRGLAAKFGLGKNNFIDALAVKDKMKADIQSLVKGIPSNYDAALFEKMVPDPTKFEDTRLYKARVDLIKRETKRMIELAVSWHKGTNQSVPEDIINAARNAGVNIEDVESFDGTEEQFRRLTQQHNQLLRGQVEAIEEEDDGSTVVTVGDKEVRIGQPRLRE